MQGGSDGFVARLYKGSTIFANTEDSRESNERDAWKDTGAMGDDADEPVPTARNTMMSPLVQVVDDAFGWL